jgi:hypothetical protein
MIHHEERHLTNRFLERIGFLSRAAVTKTVVELDLVTAGGADWAINGRRISAEADAGCDRIRETPREAGGSGEEAFPPVPAGCVWASRRPGGPGRRRSASQETPSKLSRLLRGGRVQCGGRGLSWGCSRSATLHRDATDLRDPSHRSRIAERTWPVGSRRGVLVFGPRLGSERDALGVEASG